MIKRKQIQKNLDKVIKDGKTFILAYDQGLEHGPTDFDDKNVDPNYIINIAKKAGFSALAFQKGIAFKYNQEIKKSKVPLILKVNGKTSLSKKDPISKTLCSVDYAKSLGAVGVGYTIFLGSEFESEILEDFAKIEERAHSLGMFVMVWLYPRGHNIKDPLSKQTMSYATRVALELGADIVKIRCSSNFEDLKWAVKCAGKTKVVIAGGSKIDEKSLLDLTSNILDSGAIGFAIGRNIWQNQKPLEIAKKIKDVIWNK